MKAEIAKYFNSPPFRAVHSGGHNDCWYVANSQGVNCLTFPEKRGAVFTSEKDAKQIADDWNSQSLAEKGTK